jgi:catabolite repression HPr-like protein
MASKYSSTVYIVSGNKKVNAKSIMGVMGIGIRNGEMITIVTEGSDEVAAAEDIERYLKA